MRIDTRASAGKMKSPSNTCRHGDISPTSIGSMMRKLLVVFGTRPEAIKMMPLAMELRRREGLNVVVAVTGQHRSMLDQVMADFGFKPDMDLNLMSAAQGLEGLTSAVLMGMCEVIRREQPHLVLVHGDTTTAMATALAAFYCKVTVGHVEAGLRSFDLDRPWPEELNRVYIDAVAEFLFAPTAISARNLEREGMRRSTVVVTGNTGIDALLFMSQRIREDAGLSHRLNETYGYLDPGRHLVLVTGHRRESFGDGFERICDGLQLIASRQDCEILYPVHLNPNVQKVVRERLSGQNIRLIDPVGYADMVYLMSRAKIVLTDSGGIQEEAPALGKPVLVMRDVTERPEAIETGVAKLVGTDPRLMKAEIDTLLDDSGEYARRARPVFPYGDGTASRRIADVLVDWSRK